MEYDATETAENVEAVLAVLHEVINQLDEVTRVLMQLLTGGV